MVIVTILGRYSLTLYTLKRKYPYPLSVVFSLTLLSPILFDHKILSVVINIEFPITLILLISLFRILAKGVQKKLNTCIFIVVGFLLYAITLGGDSFFIYVVSSSIYPPPNSFSFWYKYI